MRIRDDVAWTQSTQRTVALDLSRPDAVPVVLEGTAAFVWEEIAVSAPSAMADLVRALSAAFEVPEDVIHDDVVDLVSDLRERALLEE